MIEKKKGLPDTGPDHSHAWRGTWNRPMLLDERTLDPFTIARMTDHNVRGHDDDERDELKWLEDEKVPRAA